MDDWHGFPSLREMSRGERLLEDRLVLLPRTLQTTGVPGT
jgi:hypothetical protein